MSDERWAVSTQMSSWTCFRICPRRRTRKGSRWDAETSSAWRDDNKHEKRKRRDVCTQRPYPLTTHNSVTANMLFAVTEYKGLWPENRKYVLLFFCQKISLLIAQKPLPIPVFADGGCVWDVWIPRVQEPAAIRPYGHLVLQTPLLINNYRKEKTSGGRESETLILKNSLLKAHYSQLKIIYTLQFHLFWPSDNEKVILSFG